MSKTVVVTGASGFLGAWIARRLSESGALVVACDLRPDPRRLDMATEGRTLRDLIWETVDVADTKAMIALAERHRPDAIIHLAGLLIPACRANPIAAVNVNLLGHTNALEAARVSGASKVIYTSSAAARPRGPKNRVANLYGATKAAGEEIARFYFEDHAIASMGLRPTVVYGVGRDQGDTAIASLAMQAAANGQSYRLPWRAHTVFELGADIADIYTRVALAQFEGAHVSDIGSRIESTDDVIAAIREAAPEADIDYAPGAPDRPAPLTGADASPLEAIIGPLGLTPLREGARQTVDHFRRLAAR